MDILLFGPTGQLGRELSRTLLGLGEITTAGRAHAHIDCDLSRMESVRRALKKARPDLVVNAAAYTQVDRAEDEAALAHAINAEAVQVMATHCREHQAHLVHFSTDYVFSGDDPSPRREPDPVNPVNGYGASKLAGEEAIRTAGCSHFVFRTAWVYGHHGHNFLRSMLRLAGERDALSIVDDQRGAPAWSRSIAQLTTHAIARSQALGTLSTWSGVYHLSANGQTTWHGFAQAIFEGAQERGLLKKPPALSAIPSSQFPTPARRPANSVLDQSRFESRFDLTVPHWHTQLHLCLEDMQLTHA